MKRKTKSVKPSIDEDLCLAYRYLYYVLGKPIMSDKDYDKVERNVKKTKNSLLDKPGSDRAEDYPARIRALGMYLHLSMSNVKQEQKNG